MHNSAPSFFRIRNFEKFQHYHDRRPPWIKLYRDLWDDPRFFSLPDDHRYMLIGLFVIASQHDNKVMADQKWLKSQLLTNKAIPLQSFIDTGWIEPVLQDASMPLAASTVLADCYPSRARGETETETDPPIPPNGGLSNGSYPPEFETFWLEYPKHSGKGAALKVWKKIHPSVDLQGKILLAVRTQKQSPQWTKDHGQFIPNPATWLNQSRWDDDAKASGNGRPIHERWKEFT